MIQLMHGDCLELMQKIPDGSVDLICTDLPYESTQNSWDSMIDLSIFWTEALRVCKGVVVLTASQPFTSILVASNPKMFKYAWVWEKSAATGHLNAKKMPMKLHEDILVFGSGIYNPQDLKPHGKMTRRGSSGSNFGKAGTENFQEWTNYPRSILYYPHEGKPVHPTQKPIALMEYLIKTYTNEGATVLDSTMGSGTTGIAAINTNRNFIGIERDDDYFKICEQRIYDAELKVEADKIENLFGEEVTC